MNATTTPLSPLRNLQNEMQCFALPYGGIGFVIDVLVNWSICALIMDEQTLQSRELKHPLMNVYLACIGLSGGVALVIYNIVRCHDYWPLVLGSFLKGALVACLNIFSIATNWNVSKGRLEEASCLTSLLIFYPILCIPGFVGAGVVAREGWQDNRMKIVVSMCIVVFVALLVGMRIIVGRERPVTRKSEFIEWLCGLLMCLCTMSDMALNWILAVAADNLAGLPSGRDTGSISIYVVFVITLLIPLANT